MDKGAWITLAFFFFFKLAFPPKRSAKTFDRAAEIYKRREVARLVLTRKSEVSAFLSQTNSLARIKNAFKIELVS